MSYLREFPYLRLPCLKIPARVFGLIILALHLFCDIGILRSNPRTASTMYILPLAMGAPNGVVDSSYLIVDRRNIWFGSAGNINLRRNAPIVPS